MAIVCLSLVLVTGYTGQITLVQWLLAGAGVFIVGILAVRDHWPPRAMGVGGLSSAAIALVVVGRPARPASRCLASNTDPVGGNCHRDNVPRRIATRALVTTSRPSASGWDDGDWPRAHHIFSGDRGGHGLDVSLQS